MIEVYNPSILNEELDNDVKIDVYIVGEENILNDETYYACVALFNGYGGVGTYDINGFDYLLRAYDTFRFYDVKEAEFVCYQQNLRKYKKDPKQNEFDKLNYKVIKKTLYLNFDSKLIEYDCAQRIEDHNIYFTSSLLILKNYKNIINNNKKDRSGYENIKWRKNVFERDKYTCQCCSHVGCELEAHHKDGYAWCVDKRTDIDNGATLCKKCHDNFHEKYGKGKNTKEQYDEFINRNKQIFI
jgi:hypothetical protein